MDNHKLRQRMSVMSGYEWTDIYSLFLPVDIHQKFLMHSHGSTCLRPVRHSQGIHDRPVPLQNPPSSLGPSGERIRAQGQPLGQLLALSPALMPAHQRRACQSVAYPQARPSWHSIQGADSAPAARRRDVESLLMAITVARLSFPWYTMEIYRSFEKVKPNIKKRSKIMEGKLMQFFGSNHEIGPFSTAWKPWLKRLIFIRTRWRNYALSISVCQCVRLEISWSI